VKAKLEKPKGKKTNKERQMKMMATKITVK